MAAADRTRLNPLIPVLCLQARQSFLQLLRLLRAVFTLDTQLHSAALVGLYGPWLGSIVAFGQHCSSALGPAWAEVLQQVSFHQQHKLLIQLHAYLP